MYGTPTSISSSTLNIDFDELYDMIDRRLKSKSTV
jgi:hypothetical protein